MSEADAKKLTFDALAALESRDRDGAADLIARALRVGPTSGELWRSIGMLAGQIGEVELSLEASRRYAATAPVKLSKLLHYWSELTGYGRSDVVAAHIASLPAAVQTHSTVLHILGQIAAQNGDFDRARELYERVLADDTRAAKAWFSLGVITNLGKIPGAIDRMKALVGKAPATDREGRARLFYALANAYHGAGDIAQAADYYRRGGEVRREEMTYEPEPVERFALDLRRDYTADAMALLRPVETAVRASIFVNGLPRSGTTLVEQILTAHSAVADGAEINLARAALTPTREYRLADAHAFEDRTRADRDPWGHLGRQYRRMLTMRFRSEQLVVDKTLSQSSLMGLIAHAFPGCPIVWMRRDRGDVALSCYRNYFTSPMPWCWSFDAMGHYFAVEDMLFEHWQSVLGERILAVDYQALVRDPASGVRALADHCGLPFEEAMERPHESARAVRTASLQQVRQPISTKAIGQADAYAPFMTDFWDMYEKTAERLDKISG